MVRKIHILVCLVFAVLMVQSCKKYKKPTSVAFYMDMEASPIYNGKLTFSSGYFSLYKLSFDGKRKKGDDVNFEKEYTSPLQVAFDPNNASQELMFTIPQGIYEKIEMKFETDDDNGIVSLKVVGNYQNTSGDNIPVYLEINESEVFELKGTASSGQNIVLDKDVATKAKVLFNVSYWFESVPMNSFENAILTSVNGIDAIVISSTSNESIYDNIIDRLEESDKIIFNF
ncbi:MAG: hypothetical protein QE487_00520 [Fluviicola sp.]|nr:hypothetical protein [Fluviicola sp.]